MPRGKRSSTSPKDLDSLIKQLTEQRASVLRQTNEQRYAVALTAEILSIIFEHACIDSTTCLLFPASRGDSEFLLDRQIKRYRYVPLVLSAVCARWRWVAWSTPTLWTSISLQLVPDLFFTRVTTSVLRLYMQNSGSLPISLELDLRKCSGVTTNSSDRTALEHLREVVFRQNPSKFKALRITPPPTTQWLPCPRVEFSSLEDFCVYSPKLEENTRIWLQNITTIRRLCLSNVYNIKLENWLEKWPNITVLHLYRVPRDICVSLLIKCPNLISCQCYCISAYRAHLQELRGPIVFSDLKDLGWDCSWRHPDIEHFRFPSIEKLRIHDLRINYEFIRGNFFPSISSTLRVLELGHVAFSKHYEHPWDGENFLKELFQMLVNVTKLTLLASCIDIFASVLSSLTPSAGCGDVIMPSLEILQCWDLRVGSYGAQNQSKCDSRRFSKMLRMRRGQGWNGPLRLDVVGGCGMQWRKDARKEIVAMVAKGLELQIFENTLPVKWLCV